MHAFDGGWRWFTYRLRRTKILADTSTHPRSPLTSMTESKIRLHVGLWYRSRTGETVQITSYSERNTPWPFRGSSGFTYRENGHQSGDRESIGDLVELIRDPSAVLVLRHGYWIADRKPTGVDADLHSQVVVLSPDSGQWYYTFWWNVFPGKFWRPCIEREASWPLYDVTTEATPKPGPDASSDPDATSYTTRAKMPRSIAAGDTPFYVVVGDHDAGGYDTPIVFEHELPAGTGLKEALDRQQRLSDNYETLYIAECRIIPVLRLSKGQAR